MKVFLKTSPGLEKISALEAFEITGKRFESYEEILTSDCDSKDLFKLLFYARSAERIGIVAGELKILDNTEKVVGDNTENNLQYDKIEDVFFYKDESVNRILDFLKFSNFSFKTESCECFKRKYEKSFRKFLRKSVSDILIGKGFLQDLKNPDFYFLIFKIGKNFFVGIDFGELQKRKYAVFNTSFSLRHSIVYSLLRMGGFTRDFKGALIDLTSKSDFLIESVLYQKNCINEAKNINNKLILDLGKYLVGEKFDSTAFENETNKNEKECVDKKNNLSFVAYSNCKQILNITRKNSLIAGVEGILFTDEKEKVIELLKSNKKKIVFAQTNGLKELNELKKFIEVLKNSVLMIVSSKEIGPVYLKTKFEKHIIFQGLNAIFLYKLCFD